MKLKILARVAVLAAAASLAGGAHATDYTVGTMSLSAFGALGAADTWTVDDLRLSAFSWAPGSVIGSANPAGDTVSLEHFNSGANGYAFRYNTQGSSSTGQGKGSLYYTVTALNGKRLLDAWTDMSGFGDAPVGQLSLTMPQISGATVTATTNTGGAPSAHLNLLGVLSSTGTTTWDIQGSTYVSSLQNNYRLATSVPAPLPLLGVIAAFSWGLRLRRRTRQGMPLAA